MSSERSVGCHRWLDLFVRWNELEIRLVCITHGQVLRQKISSAYPRHLGYLQHHRGSPRTHTQTYLITEQHFCTIQRGFFFLFLSFMCGCTHTNTDW